jgi:predicted nucleotidyltransferase
MDALFHPFNMRAAEMRNAADYFVAVLQTELPARLRAAWLFGSAARGDARPDSDIDVLVILDAADAATLRKVYTVADRLSRRNRVDLSIKVLDEREYAQESGSPFLRNVKAEGVALA